MAETILPFLTTIVTPMGPWYPYPVAVYDPSLYFAVELDAEDDRAVEEAAWDVAAGAVAWGVEADPAFPVTEAAGPGGVPEVLGAVKY